MFMKQKTEKKNQKKQHSTRFHCRNFGVILQEWGPWRESPQQEPPLKNHLQELLWSLPHRRYLGLEKLLGGA